MIRHALAIFIVLLTATAPNVAPSVLARQGAEVSTPESAAVYYSQLEAGGAFDELYEWIHPDARAVVPATAVIGWYTNEFAPQRAGVITVTGVEFTSWTWEVTGTTYPNTAVVYFQQPFADGSVIEEVVRLVESDGTWRWFFGRNREFVDAQILKYGSRPVPSGEVCAGAAEWWTETFPRTFPASYFNFAFPSIWNGGNVNVDLLQSYSDSFSALHQAQLASAAPPAAAELQAQLLGILDDYARAAENLARARSGNLNPLAESGALSAGLGNIDSAGSSLLTLDKTIEAFLSECDPVVVFVFGMGEDLPIGVLPGQVGSGIPAVECSLFPSQDKAQRFFEAAQPGDPHNLDSDGDGVACNSEPKAESTSPEGLAASLYVTPEKLQVTPGGSSVYVAQPLLWGDWSASDLTLHLELRLPPEITIVNDAICAPRKSVIPTTSTCEVRHEIKEDGSTVIGARASAAKAGQVALHVPVEFGAELEPDEMLRVHAILRVVGGGPIGNIGDGDFQTIYAWVVDALGDPADPPNRVSGRIEFTGPFSIVGDVCHPTSEPWDLVLYEWGEQEVVARLTTPTGYIGAATGRQGTDVCLIEFAFGGLAENAVYTIARVTPGETVACRACFLGTITPSQQAIPVFVID